MIYNIIHKTEYRYADAVSLCHNVLRLRPRDYPGQSCLRYQLSVSPKPASQSARTDFFGNTVTWVNFQEPHKELIITAASRVRVEPPAIHDLTQSLPWETAQQKLSDSLAAPFLEARQFLFESPHVRCHPELAEYARPSFTPGRPLLEAVRDVTERIYHEFTFQSGVTEIGTSILDVLHSRKGVCQDFAHLQIGCLRSIGLAARYVSGYIVTQPPPGQARLQGVDASHAWLSLFDPTFGWVDFDPTNGLMPSDQHITIAWARDYEEIGPVRGIVVGGERHWLNVEVDVIPLGEN